mgnify:CR=1 FL=1
MVKSCNELKAKLEDMQKSLLHVRKEITDIQDMHKQATNDVSSLIELAPAAKQEFLIELEHLIDSFKALELKAKKFLKEIQLQQNGFWEKQLTA